MVLDIITGVLVAFGFYQGFSKGLIKTVFETLSILIALVAAFKLSAIVIHLLQQAFQWHQGILFALGFVITFIGSMLLVRFIGKKLEKLFKSLQLSSINKLMGGLLLALYYATLVSIGINLTDKIGLISEEQKSISFAYPILEPLMHTVQSIGESLRPAFQEFWNALIETMDAIKEKGQDLGK